MVFKAERYEFLQNWKDKRALEEILKCKLQNLDSLDMARTATANLP